MLAIIPARGGSKGLPRKNVKILYDKPLVAYTIEAAKCSNSIDRIVLSTDDPEIAQIGIQHGAEVPFMRPQELAQDTSFVIDTYLYTIERLQREFNLCVGEFVALNPTTPLRKSQDIDQAVELFVKRGADSVISCTQLHHPAEWIFTMREDGLTQKDVKVEFKKMMNRQESHPSFVPNGAVYVYRYSFLKERYSYFSDKTYAYVMPAERSVDIDSELDFKFAEFLMGRRTVHD